MEGLILIFVRRKMFFFFQEKTALTMNNILFFRTTYQSAVTNFTVKTLLRLRTKSLFVYIDLTSSDTIITTTTIIITIEQVKSMFWKFSYFYFWGCLMLKKYSRTKLKLICYIVFHWFRLAYAGSILSSRFAIVPAASKMALAIM